MSSSIFLAHVDSGFDIVAFLPRWNVAVPNRVERERIARLYARILTGATHTSVAHLSLPARIFALALYERRTAMPLSELAALAGVSPHAASRALAALQEDGLVAVEPDPNDSRAKVVRAKPQLVAVVDTILRSFEDAMTETGTFLIRAPRK
jgi:DNA-binding MarR family transcriptional regulator